jgi:hypothetical protein
MMIKIKINFKKNKILRKACYYSLLYKNLTKTTHSFFYEVIHILSYLNNFY